VPPTQQPPAQVLLSHEHVPLLVSHKPLPQVPQACPAVPHWPGVCCAYGTHVLPLQQPAHVAGSQVHPPGPQVSPGAHAWPPGRLVLHLHSPPPPEQLSPMPAQNTHTLLPALGWQKGKTPSGSHALL
jgi:hypothetical protein